MRRVVTSPSRSRHFSPRQVSPLGVQTTKCFLKLLYSDCQGSLISLWSILEEKEKTVSATTWRGRSISPGSQSLCPRRSERACSPDLFLPHKHSTVKLQAAYLRLLPYKYRTSYLVPGNLVYKTATDVLFKSSLTCFWVDDFFFSFPPAEFTSEGWVLKIAAAREIHADTAFIPLSFASKGVGNVQLRTDLWLYTNGREYSSILFFFLSLWKV